ncbi:MAG: transporter [Rhodospirillaceae bacterium]|nr:MAG: transporter [Rhodospirillaceae bacterium]
MISLSLLSLYFITLITFYVLPGPDMALVMATSVSRGIRTSLLTAIGIAGARFLHVAMSGLGLAAILATHPILFEVLRWAGAAYLVWLAWKVIRSNVRVTGLNENASSRSAVMSGFLTNLLNPKALMFCAFFLPQFVSPENGAILPQFLILGLILVFLGLSFDTIYAFAANHFARRLPRHHSVVKLQKTLLASVFIAMAGRLILGRE